MNAVDVCSNTSHRYICQPCSHQILTLGSNCSYSKKNSSIFTSKEVEFGTVDDMSHLSSTTQHAVANYIVPTTPFVGGFLLNTINGHIPTGFNAVPLLPGLSIEATTEIESAGSFYEKFVIIIGSCVPTGARISSRSPVAEHLLDCLQQSETSFYRTLAIYTGRHAIIYGDRNNVKIVNDATAMRTVFYASAGGVVASHALLVEETLTGTIRKSEMPFRYG